MALGAFVAAPVGGLLWGFGALLLRLSIQYGLARVTGQRFDAFDRPPPPPLSIYSGAEGSEEDREQVVPDEISTKKGKFV